MSAISLVAPDDIFTDNERWADLDEWNETAERRAQPREDRALLIANGRIDNAPMLDFETNGAVQEAAQVKLR